jgi:peptidoglycan hydrolase-like protein with peptidoglycan-binding domain
MNLMVKSVGRINLTLQYIVGPALTVFLLTSAVAEGQQQLFREMIDALRQVQQMPPLPPGTMVPAPQLGPAPSSASGSAISSSKPTIDCSKSLRPLALILCSAEDAAKADWDVNAAVWAYAFSLEEGDRKAFWQEQDAWITSLTTTCKLSTASSGSKRQCVVNAYRARAKALQTKLTGDGLDETKLTPEQRAEIQGRLISLGFLSGNPDGEFGSNTRSGIRKFQQANGFELSNYLTARQRQMLASPTGVASSAAASGGPGDNSTDRMPPTMARPSSGFADFERLLELPHSCSALRQAGRSQLTLRDPFGGRSRSTPGPACGLANECFSALSAQLGTLMEYLRNRPLLVSELKKQPLKQPLPAGAMSDFDLLLRSLAPKGYSQVARPDLPFAATLNCDHLYDTVGSMIVLPNPRMVWMGGFEPFAALARNWLANLRLVYAADIARYADWSPYARHYGHADEFARLKAKYETAYNGSDIEAFLRLRPDFLREMTAADEFKTTLLRQTDKLASLGDQLSDTSHRIATEPLSKAIQPDVPEAISKLKVEIDRLRDLAAADRGDATNDINRFETATRDIESKINAAQTRIDDLNKLDARRQTAVSDVTEALAALSNAPVQNRLNQAGVALGARLEATRDQLSKLAAIPLLDRQDYVPLLETAGTLLGETAEIRRAVAATDAFVEHGAVLKAEIDRRGRRFLDPDTSDVVSTLSRTADAMVRKTLPLSEADQKELSNDMRTLADIESRLPQMMDKQERKYLIGQFPTRRGQWMFEFKIDKLTDAQSVSAMTVAEGDQARYQIEISCKGDKRALRIMTFEKKSESGKPIPWTVVVLNPLVVKRIGLRTDFDPPYDVTLAHDGYSNAGIISGVFDPQFKLINSSRFVFGDIFPGDRVEMETNFPKPFQRLCALM